MLILVAVTVNVLIESGIIGSAKNAANKTQTAYENEATLGKITIGGKEYNSIDEYISNKSEEIHNWEYTDISLAALKCTCEECKADERGDGTGLTLTIGQEVDYEEGGTGSSTISGIKSGVTQGIIDGYLSESDYGENGKQTISKDADTTWVVFGREDKNGNGTFETLLLTTKTPTTETITFYGADAYLYGPEEIDRMCKEMYGEEARGMTIEDVNRTLGYTPTGGMYATETGIGSTGNFNTQLNGKIKDTENEYNEAYVATGIWGAMSSQEMLYSPEQNNNTGSTYELKTRARTLVTSPEALEEYVIDGYMYVATEEMASGVYPYAPSTTSSVVKSLIFGADFGNCNWLASRGVVAKGYYAAFEIGCVCDGVAYSFEGAGYTSDSAVHLNPLCLRAVVPLPSGVPDVSGT